MDVTSVRPSAIDELVITVTGGFEATVAPDHPHGRIMTVGP